MRKFVLIAILLLTASSQLYSDNARPRLTLSMTIKNEADHYLRPMLESAREYITDAVIIDDGSSDNSVEICREVLKDIPLTIVRNEQSKFAKEYLLRQQQWDETIKTNPEWILVLDADQIFEHKFKDEVPALLSNANVDVYTFRLYDFWDENHYRDDGYWCAHNTYRAFLVRYRPGSSYSFRQKDQHCGHFPMEISHSPHQERSELRLKHYGWAKAEERQRKFLRYQQLDPGAKFGWQEQYDSILDENPHVVLWEE